METPYEMAKALREARTDPEVRRKSSIEKSQLQSQDRARPSFQAGNEEGRRVKKQAQQKPPTHANRGKGGAKGGGGNDLNVNPTW